MIQPEHMMIEKLYPLIFQHGQKDIFHKLIKDFLGGQYMTATTTMKTDKGKIDDGILKMLKLYFLLTINISTVLQAF